jgi:hypothetical protein
MTWKLRWKSASDGKKLLASIFFLRCKAPIFLSLKLSGVNQSKGTKAQIHETEEKQFESTDNLFPFPSALDETPGNLADRVLSNTTAQNPFISLPFN